MRLRGIIVDAMGLSPRGAHPRSPPRAFLGVHHACGDGKSGEDGAGESTHGGEVARHTHPLSLSRRRLIGSHVTEAMSIPPRARTVICERARLPRLPRREETRASAAKRPRDASTRGRPLEPSLLPLVAVIFGFERRPRVDDDGRFARRVRVWRGRLHRRGRPLSSWRCGTVGWRRLVSTRTRCSPKTPSRVGVRFHVLLLVSPLLQRNCVRLSLSLWDAERPHLLSP